MRKKGLLLALSEVGGEVGTEVVGGAMLAAGVVEELVFADGADGEVTGLGMGNHEAADAGMGEHGAMLGETYADGGEVDEAVEVEVEALVGKAGIAHGRTDALESLGMEVGNGEIFVRGITPIVLADGLMSAFDGSLGQAVGKGLTEQVAVGIGFVSPFCVEVFYAFIGAGGKDADAVADAFGVDGTYEVGQAEKRLRLLAEEGEGILMIDD